MKLSAYRATTARDASVRREAALFFAIHNFSISSRSAVRGRASQILYILYNVKHMCQELTALAEQSGLVCMGPRAGDMVNEDRNECSKLEREKEFLRALRSTRSTRR